MEEVLIYMFILFIVGLYLLYKITNKQDITIVELQNGQDKHHLNKEGFWINYKYNDRMMQGPRYGPITKPQEYCGNGLDFKRYDNGSIYSPEHINVKRHGDRTWWNTSYLNLI